MTVILRIIDLTDCLYVSSIINKKYGCLLQSVLVGCTKFESPFCATSIFLVSILLQDKKVFLYKHTFLSLHTHTHHKGVRSCSIAFQDLILFFRFSWASRQDAKMRCAGCCSRGNHENKPQQVNTINSTY